MWIESSLDPEFTLPLSLNHFADSNSVPPEIWVCHRYVDFKYLYSELSCSSLFFLSVAFFIYFVIVSNSFTNTAIFLFFCLLPLWEMMLSSVFIFFF